MGDTENILHLAAMNDAPPAVTEDGAALKFADRYRNELRYDHDVGKWFRWTGKYWECERTKLAFDWARQLARELASASANKNKQISKTTFATGVERFARADRAFAVTSEIWDSDPWLFNTEAGTIDLRTGRMSPHNPRDDITKIAPTSPDGTAPTWLAFLKRVTGGGQEHIDYLQRVVGYCLTGSTQEHALFFLYGTGANGKSTFLNAITSALGDYHRTAPIETFTSSNTDRHPTDLAGLPASSPPSRPRREDAGLKAASGRSLAATRYRRGLCGRIFSNTCRSSS